MTTLTRTNSIHRSPLLRGLLLIPLVLACFALSPAARGVIPAPDGGYPGFNTAEGTNALFSRTTGVQNTALGAYSLFSDTSGNFNTAVGTNALRFNTTASFNTATGVAALKFNTTGINNTAVGTQALLNNNGDSNTAVGVNALVNNTTGTVNTAVGQGALAGNTVGDFNAAFGFQALAGNSTGFINTANGAFALHNNSTGDSNTATGFHALSQNDTGSQNTAIGDEALFGNVSGFQNTAVGVGALNNNGGITGGGSRNTAVGAFALGSNPTGNNNIALGNGAGNNLLDGNNNIDIGSPGVFVESGTIRIGSIQARTFIAGIRGRATGFANAIPVLIDSAGQLDTASSSARFKKEIKAMDRASESILAFKPVTFRYKSDNTNTPQFGLIAEEVAEVNPDLVVRDPDGKAYTVRYDAVNAMLLNEFLKEHRKNEEQEKTIVELKSGLTALAATVKEQAAQIQKVSAQLEVSKAAPQVVNNP
jgi:hypothetical protein